LNQWQQFLQDSEKNFAQLWMDTVRREIPDQNDEVDFSRYAPQLSRLLIDLNVPLEEHPCHNIIPEMSQAYAQNKVPFDRMLHVFHLSRECVYEILEAFAEKKQVSAAELYRFASQWQQRLDRIQRLSYRLYSNYISAATSKERHQFDESHHERLSMLGKMAASMAHELRNPLFAIHGFLKLIRMELLSGHNQKVFDYLDVIQEEFKGLFSKISEFLSFSKNSGEGEPFVPCTSREIIESVLELVHPRLLDEGIEIELKLGNSARLIAQKSAIQQVLTNLINNSIDALIEVNSPKKIVIRDYEDKQHYYIQITDNGIGIPEELQGTIFDPFITGKNNGTGLGLSICKQIMEKNNGDIHFHSRKGETTFTLTFAKY